MAVSRNSKPAQQKKGMPRETIAAGLRCLVLVTVFALTRLQEAAHSHLFEIAVAAGAVYVMVTTFVPLSRRDPRRAAMLTQAIDVALITLLVYADSGVTSNYYLLYFVPILVAGAKADFRDSIVAAGLSAAGYLVVGALQGPAAVVTTSAMSRALSFGIPIGMMAIFFAILVNEQQKHARLAQQYEDAMRAKADFLSKVSHEFRTPLTAIVGFSQLLYEHSDTLDPKRQKEYLAIVREQSQHLARMIEDILDLTKIEEGRLKLKRQAMQVSDVIETALMLLDHPEDRERVALSVEPRTRAVYADRNELEQVMARLLHTAFKLSEVGASVPVRIGPAVEDDAIQVSIHLSPLDECEEALAPLTESAEKVVARKSDGKSLGLAAARALIELHGGRIWVEESYDTGVALTFVLPVCQPKEIGPEVIVGVTIGPEAAGAEAHGEDNDRGRRPVRAKAHAGQP